MKSNKSKLYILGLLIALVTLSISAISPKSNPPKKRNLKVLPENISDDSLDHLMDYYKYALNIKCGYCHAKSKTNPKKRDMASDDNPIKDVARKMILMTNEMNEKYIKSINHPITDSSAVQTVTCYTCHRGKCKPEIPTYKD